MTYSLRTEKQFKQFSKTLRDGNTLNVLLRFDDQCRNGHNTFSITGEILNPHKKFIAGGCLHEEIARHFPKFKHLIPYHLCSTDGPMHYTANTMYHAKAISKHQGKYYFYLEDHLIKIVNEDEAAEMRIKYGDNCKFVEYFNSLAKEPDLKAARSSAIWPDATLEQLQDRDELLKRLKYLIQDFREKMLAIGFI